jgi:hypothetical protein
MSANFPDLNRPRGKREGTIKNRGFFARPLALPIFFEEKGNPTGGNGRCGDCVYASIGPKANGCLALAPRDTEFRTKNRQCVADEVCFSGQFTPRKGEKLSPAEKTENENIVDYNEDLIDEIQEQSERKMSKAFVRALNQ